MRMELSRLRRNARSLASGARRGDPAAADRFRAAFPGGGDPTNARALDVVARENGWRSWPRLLACGWLEEMSPDERAERLKLALYFGQHWIVDEILARHPETANANLGLQIALFEKERVSEAVAGDPEAAVRPIGPRTPILHLAFSRRIGAAPEKAADAVEIAELLIANGADVNDGFAPDAESGHRLSALYGAVGHADNFELAEWLLGNGADPNDGESLYHSTEVPHRKSTALLLERGARVDGTNALLRALDFNDHPTVRMMLDSGADPNADVVPHPSGEPPLALPALHQAARRMCDAEMADLLMAAGADPARRHDGLTPHQIARIYGNRAYADALEAQGHACPLDGDLSSLALAADGAVQGLPTLDVAALPSTLRSLLHDLQQYPDRLNHSKRLVGMGFAHESTDDMGLTPAQLAGWEGLPDSLEYWLSLDPDLRHVNGFGGDLLSTIVHGSENCPKRESRDHIACARMALSAGVPLPALAPRYAGVEDMVGFLSEWAEEHPEQVAADGPY